MLSTHTDRKKAEKAIKLWYKYLKLEEPEIFWRESVEEGAKLAAQMIKGNDKVSEKEIQKAKRLMELGSLEADTVYECAFWADHIDKKEDELVDIALQITNNIGFYWNFHGAVVLVPKPTGFYTNDLNKEQRCLRFPNDTAYFY